MNIRRDHHRGVSEVVGEMLMIALVVILLSVFSSGLFDLLPADRDPSVSIMLSNDRQNITLWHKGGDWVEAKDITVVIGNETSRFSHSLENGLILVPGKPVFDLGSNITVRMASMLEGNETVRVVTPHTVIFTGKVSV